MTTLFITGSGTDVGKTFVAEILLRQLRAADRAVHALKPIATGFDPLRPAESDAGRLLRAQGIEPTLEAVCAVSPWRFAAPLSPDMAAAREGRSLPFAEIVALCRRSRAAGVTLVEGVGGVMVPLDHEHTVLDWMAELGAPALLVTGSYLGTLSHTLTAAGMLRLRGVRIAGLIVNESAACSVPLDETAQVLQRFLPSLPVVAVRRGATELPKLAERLGL